MKMITFLCSIYYVASNIPFFFFLKNAEFVCSVDRYLSVVKERFLDRERGENIKCKFGDLGDILPK